MMQKEEFRNRIAGSLMAGAIGDALGYEVEFDRWREIERKFGKTGIRELVLHGGKALISDDTQMTLFTLEGMLLGLEREKETGYHVLPEDNIYDAYLCWLKTQYPDEATPESLWEEASELLRIPEMRHRRAPGNTCLSALCSGKMGTIEEPINHSKGCGGVMRTAPLGFTRGMGDPIVNGAKGAAIPHGHPMGYVPAGMLSGIVETILFEEKMPLEEIIFRNLKKAEAQFAGCEGMDAFSAMVRKAADLSKTDENDVAAIESIGGGWVGDEALAVAIYCVLKYENNITEALISAVNHSGDSDSTAAIAGNILGTYLGIQAIDPEWIRNTELSEKIMKMASQAADAFYPLQ